MSAQEAIVRGVFIKGDPKLTLSLPCKSDTYRFTLSNARRFYSSMGDPTGVKGLTQESLYMLTNLLNKKSVFH